ncbi:hypothetical protein LZ32DRAFT_295356 [Colletotrichum eremochloae]|nr:hypothetical protein LZ32DRAFT_295356 [Colletotrichum eremochloae]
MLDAATTDSLAHLLSFDSLGMPTTSQLNSTLNNWWRVACFSLVVQRLPNQERDRKTPFPSANRQPACGKGREGRSRSSLGGGGEALARCKCCAALWCAVCLLPT